MASGNCLKENMDGLRGNTFSKNSRWSASKCQGGGCRWNRVRGKGFRDETKDLPEELIDPCKVFVSNLQPQVTEAMLRVALSHYADVEKVTIIKDKHTRKSKCYGFVKVKTQEDVGKLLGLSVADRYIHGREVVIQLARKKVNLPGDDGYVRRPLPERDFDLCPPDPTLPSIHVLVDDVMYKIFSYLPIKTLIRCEGVSRRWQMLVHSHFSKRTTLEINESSLELSAPFTKAIISKLLILSGPNLRSLKVQRIDFVIKQNILKIISQLCPMLEHLDVTRARGINFNHISRLAAGCQHIKSFIAKNCIEFDEKALHHLLINYPGLERLNVAGSAVYGKNFNLLPSTLKELSIERIPDLCHKRKKITEIADRCPNLEILEMKECMLFKSDLEYFGKKCTKLTKLSVYLPSLDATEALSCFTNLKDLTLVGDEVDLLKLFKGLSKIEVLSVETRDVLGGEADFSLIENLKVLKLIKTLAQSSLQTLCKCKHLEEIHLLKCYSLSTDIILLILKGCTKLKKIVCPNLQVTSAFITLVDDIMKGRSGKLHIEIRNYGIDLDSIDYDKKKIHIEHYRDFSDLFDPFGYDSDNSDYYDESFNTSWYDSDIDFDDYHFLGHDDFEEEIFDAAVMLAAWNIHDPDLY